MPLLCLKKLSITMNKLLLLIVLPLLLLSCKGNSNNDLHLFNNIMFSLNEDESRTQITEELQEAYFKYINEKPFQVPIFMIIENHNYQIYIGIPVGTNLEELAGADIKEGAQIITDPESDLSTYAYRQYSYDAEFISEYAVKVNENLLFLFAITDSYEVSESMFNLNELAGRIFAR